MAWYVPVYEALVHSAVAGCVLLGLATVAVFALRQPARRIRVIETALAALLLLPALALIPGYPRLAKWPPTALAEEPLDESTPAAPPLAVAVDEPSFESERPPTSLGTETPEPPLPAIAEQSAATPADASPIAIPWRLPRDVRFWIVTLYFGGVAVMIGWSLVGLAAAAWLLRHAQPAGESCRALFRQVAGPAGQRVALVASSRASQPCALIWRRPTIVLPEALAAGGDVQQLRWTLAHEWSHVARGDAWSWAGANLVRWFYFYQPLVWYLRRQLRLSQDFLADAAAAQSGESAEDYAEFLTSLSAGRRRPSPAVGLGILDRASDLRRRIVMLVETRRPLEAAAPKRWNLIVLPTALLVVAAVASVRAEPAQPNSETKPEPDVSARQPAASPGRTPSAAQSRADLPPGVTEAEIEMQLARDPLIVQFTQQIAKLTQDLQRIRNKAVAGEFDVRPYQKQILELEEGLEERKAKLRPNIVELLAVLAKRRPAAAAPPFSGRIRPGDQLKVDVVGGFPEEGNRPREATVEPNGGLALGPMYGRVDVGGKTLTEAETLITEHLTTILKDPRVQLTYEGHDPDVVADDQAPPTDSAARPTAGPSRNVALDTPSRDVVVLRPLDTVQIVLPQGSATRIEQVDGKLREIIGPLPFVSGVYVIEPNGDISLPHDYGRVNVDGMDERAAGTAIRKRASEKLHTRTALPSAYVVKRGRAVFPEGKHPEGEYRIRPGDQLLIGSQPNQMFTYQVDDEGSVNSFRVQSADRVRVEGLSLAEAQTALRGDLAKESTELTFPPYVTLGGWREEADPEVIDRLGDRGAGDLQSLKRELLELKHMVRELQAQPR